MAESDMPQFWKDNIKAFWKLRVAESRPVVSGCTVPVVQATTFTTVTLSGYSTVHYHQLQTLPLSKYTIKLGYWCLVRRTHKVPVPRCQNRWAGMPWAVEWPLAWSGVRAESVSKKQAWRALRLMHCVGSSTVRLCSECKCMCGMEVADMWHGIFECTRAKALWRVVGGRVVEEVRREERQ